MKWFKFYGQDYLTDPKMLALSGSERSCWITLLSYGSVNDNGMITFLSEEQLMVQSGISFTDEEWDNTKGILKKLENLEMIRIDNGKITILNWGKRQETSLTPYERVKKYREKKKNDNEMITLEEIRVDKKRVDKKREDKPENHQSFLIDIPEDFITTLLEKYNTTPKGIKDLGEKLHNYCLAKGKKYSNYKAFYLNAAKRDFTEKNDADRERQKKIDESRKAPPSPYAKQLSEKYKVT